MSNYVKYLKDILTKKWRLGVFKTVALTKECRTILMRKVIEKMKDLGGFTIPVSIGGQSLGWALCNLGGSINLIHMSVY